MPDSRASTLRIVLPGVAMIAVTFGLARYGYGLLLPEMRDELGVGSRTGGLIASGSYVSYLVANTGVVWLTGRFGPRLPIAGAATTAAVGMVLISKASGALGLAVGVLVAGTAAGLAFPPYADVVDRNVPAASQAVSWSAISSGTGWGVAIAGPLAIICGAQWRLVWLVFAGLSVAAGVVAVVGAPARRSVSADCRPPRLSRSWFMCPRSRPLLLSAILIGAGSSVWWAFSVDALRAAGLAATPARAVYAVCGAAGIVASATGLVTECIGLRRCYQAACVAVAGALGLLGLSTGNVVAALVAGTLFGVSYNGVIAAQGLWSAAVFSDRPSAGLCREHGSHRRYGHRTLRGGFRDRQLRVRRRARGRCRGSAPRHPAVTSHGVVAESSGDRSSGRSATSEPAQLRAISL